MKILSFARKKLPPEMPPGVQFLLPSTIDIVLATTSRVVGVYRQDSLAALISLSPNELLALLIFHEFYPYYASDTAFLKAFGSKEAVDRVLTQMRSKMHRIGFAIERMRETGYFLVLEDTPLAK